MEDNPAEEVLPLVLHLAHLHLSSYNIISPPTPLPPHTFAVPSEEHVSSAESSGHH